MNVAESRMVHQHTEEFEAKAQVPEVVLFARISERNVRINHVP